MPMSVILVDDHPLFVEGLKVLLTDRDMNVAGVANNGFDASQLVHKLRPDVVLMELNLPDCNGLDLMQQFITASPNTKVVILTTCDNEQYIIEAAKNGASGYLMKSLNTERFFELLTGLSSGQIAMTQEFMSKIIIEFAGSCDSQYSASAHR